VRRESSPGPEVTGNITDLVMQARRGEAAAYRALFRLHVQRVNRIVRRLGGASADVDDLVQAVFAEAFRSLPAFRGDALFSTWLARIAVRVTMRALRRPALRLVPLVDADDAPADDAGPEGIAGAREALAWLNDLLSTLRPKRRVAFVLHVLEGYSMEEIAAIVDASVAAVKVRIHDARCEIERRLRKHPQLVADWGLGGPS
jgi:RNA polymerase sigma-70 factor (ECF subfamily)